VASRTAMLAILPVMAIGLSGCLGYRTGTSLPASISSVHVATFVNKVGEPDIETTATSATIREFQKDGSLKVLGEDEADTIVETTLSGMALEPLRYSRDRATETTEFRLLLTADVVFKDRKSGKIISSHKQLTGKTTFDPAGDLSSAKRLAIQPAAQDLAHEIVAAVVEAW